MSGLDQIAWAVAHLESIESSSLSATRDGKEDDDVDNDDEYAVRSKGAAVSGTQLNIVESRTTEGTTTMSGNNENDISIATSSSNMYHPRNVIRIVSIDNSSNDLLRAGTTRAEGFGAATNWSASLNVNRSTGANASGNWVEEIHPSSSATCKVSTIEGADSIEAWNETMPCLSASTPVIVSAKPSHFDSTSRPVSIGFSSASRVSPTTASSMMSPSVPFTSDAATTSSAVALSTRCLAKLLDMDLEHSSNEEEGEKGSEIDVINNLVPPSPPTSDAITTARENDVMCGRGGETNHHPGNMRYRQLVKACQPAYIAAKRRDKPKIAEKIVHAVRKLNGRFIKKDPIKNIWIDVGNKKAREKTSQALREGAPEYRNGQSVDDQHTPDSPPQIQPTAFMSNDSSQTAHSCDSVSSPSPSFPFHMVGNSVPPLPPLSSMHHHHVPNQRVHHQDVLPSLSQQDLVQSHQHHHYPHQPMLEIQGHHQRPLPLHHRVPSSSSANSAFSANYMYHAMSNIPFHSATDASIMQQTGMTPMYSPQPHPSLPSSMSPGMYTPQTRYPLQHHFGTSYAAGSYSIRNSHHPNDLAPMFMESSSAAVSSADVNEKDQGISSRSVTEGSGAMGASSLKLLSEKEKPCVNPVANTGTTAFSATVSADDDDSTSSSTTQTMSSSASRSTASQSDNPKAAPSTAMSKSKRIGGESNSISKKVFSATTGTIASEGPVSLTMMPQSSSSSSSSRGPRVKLLKRRFSQVDQ
jgi:hypothetical protein